MTTLLLSSLPLIDHLEDALRVTAAPAPAWPAFEISDADDETVLTADVPGMSDADLELTVAGPVLTIRGERKLPEGGPLRARRRYGAFQRRFRIADGHELDAIEASVRHGELVVRIPKAASSKPRRIKLKGGVISKVKQLISGDPAPTS